MTETLTRKSIYNTIPLRGIVAFPRIVTSFELARPQSINALKAAEADDGLIFLVTQKDMGELEVSRENLYGIGVVAKIKKSLKLDNKRYQVVVEGLFRAEMLTFEATDDLFQARVLPNEFNFNYDRKLLNVAMLGAKAAFNNLLSFVPKPADEILTMIQETKEAGYLADLISATALKKPHDKQSILEESNELARLNKLTLALEKEIEIIELEGAIHGKVQYRLQQHQRDIYLKEQLNVIQNELGINSSEDNGEPFEYYKSITEAKLPIAVRDKLLKEAEKLNNIPFGSAEGSVVRNYIEVCLELPWEKKSKERLDLEATRKILDTDHDGLEKIKQRILEYIAVKKLAPKLDGQILCLVGPPGVGKTSIAKSIARAVNRKYVRISLGGIRDEAEIRGHRKTYVGSMPGRIINALKLAGTSNPVMLLDEIDKLGQNSLYGDTSAALLEVLDSEQNKTFRDNFIELPFDISDCMFIATANSTDSLPSALLDRMEVIRMDSYSDNEKLAIAKNHLIPKQMKKHGLNKRMLKFDDEGIIFLINNYTMESGVRNLEREIASICRKVAKKIVSGEIKSMTVKPQQVKDLLGAERYLAEHTCENDMVGMVNGLAWTQYGGDMLRIEAVSMPGNGALELTGSLGDVMKESAKASVSYIRKHASELGVAEDFYKKFDIHIHVPEGAIPKDGPSAGITITTALLSELLNKPVKQSVAMTGEITLTGRVLKIGGLKEKSSAARKAGIKTIIIPKDNEGDIKEFDESLKSEVEFKPVSHISEVFEYAF
ncbi:MAG: endopeptidase La [Eubacteriales bacterium]|nr:endopeptidase La [Eubacteriales bacterium]MDD4474503.1 endopeptidase La [Eubacteriales bacterium]